MENVNDTQKIQELLDSFAEGTITSSDFIQLKNWINESEAHRDEARHALQLDAALMVEAGKPDIDVEAAISRFHDYIGDKKAKTIPLWAKIAAAVALVLIIALPYVAYHAGTDSVKATFADVCLEAPAGSQLNMTLPDGTKIRLNSGSVISYSQGFGITDRTVNLQGEAFFEVKHNKKLSFTVKTKELSVKDLGTSFLFSNYKDEPTAKVELFDGKVSLDNELTHTEGVLLTPGQCAVMDKKSGMLTTSQLTITKEEAKSQNTLTFTDMPLADIARILSRSYGQAIVVAHSVAGIKFYGQFNRQKDNLQDILQSMSDTGKMRYKKENGKYVLYQ